MPSDYAEPSRRTPRRKRRSAVRPDVGKRRKQGAPEVRVSTGFAYTSGLCTGLFIAAALWLAPTLLGDSRVSAPVQEWLGWLESPGQPAVVSSPAAPASTKLEDTLSFYNELPNRRSWVTVVDEYEPAAAPATGSAYLLQAGSFRQADDAERLRAELLLLNLAVHIRRVELSEGVVWHRVLVGPFDAAQAMRRALTRLRSAQIDAIPLRQG